MIGLLTWAAVGLGAAGALSVCVLAVRRIVVGRSDRIQAEAENRLLPVAISLLEGERVPTDSLTENDAQLLAALLSRLGRNVRGESSERIAAFFEQNGLVARELGTLSSPRAWRRASAAFALGDMASSAAVAGLLDALEDPDGDVRAAAARSLGRLGAVAAVEPIVYALAGNQLPRSVAGQALLAIGPAALPRLRALLAAPEPNARSFAVELVGLLGDASDDVSVLERLRDSSAEVRAKAARALGRLGTEQATTALTAALDDRIGFVRVSAARALGDVGDRDAVPALLRVASGDEFDAARAAASLDPAGVRVAAVRPGAGPHLVEAADLLELHA
jgi:HEAT repeat protein